MRRVNESLLGAQRLMLDQDVDKVVMRSRSTASLEQMTTLTKTNSSHVSSLP
jgi:hypothetical protein